MTMDRWILTLLIIYALFVIGLLGGLHVKVSKIEAHFLEVHQSVEGTFYGIRIPNPE